MRTTHGLYNAVGFGVPSRGHSRSPFSHYEGYICIMIKEMLLKKHIYIMDLCTYFSILVNDNNNNRNDHSINSIN